MKTSREMPAVQLMKSYCLSLLFVNFVFVGLPAYLQRRLQAVLNAAARLVFRLRRLCNERKVTGRGVGSGCGVTRRRR